ncbi:MAG: P-loop NTPase [Thermodesulfobacteriaceae bacterium]|nr:P-loop NTPase [Thermodesulfobacteriaceae bacterium]
MRKIAVCGKGGVGKSFIVYAMARTLAKWGKNILVVDADESNQTLYKLFGFHSPAPTLIDFLGGKKSIQQSIKKGLQSGKGEPLLSVIERESLKMEDLPQECIKRVGNIALVSIGKIKEPLEGCACPMGIVSREFLEKIELQENEVIIVDTEAGVEHFGRGIEKGIDTVIVVAEPYLDSIEVAEKALFLAQKLEKKVYLILNKVPTDIEDKVKDMIQRRGLNLTGIVPFSSEICYSSMEGKIPEQASVFERIEAILEKIYERV